MDENLISCPNCNAKIPLTSAIEQPIVERLQAQFAAEAAKKDAAGQKQLQAQLDAERKKLALDSEKRAKEAVSIQLADLQQQLVERDKAIAVSKEEQLNLLKLKRELESQRQAFELEKQKLIEAERQKIRDEATKAAAEEANTELLALRQSLAVKDQKLAEAQQSELAVRKQKAELEEERKAIDVEMSRQGDVIKEKLARELGEEYRLKEAEKNKQFEDMRRQIDDLRRKADQGSPQARGEVLEVDLETTVARCFGNDVIVPVPKGTHGGDLLQTVRDEFGNSCGTIIWELKRTKTWSDGWLAKLKDDKLAAKAQIALLVSVTMPRDVASFECRGNVWIAPPPLAVPLAAALRLSLMEAAAARRAGEGRHEKMEAVYDYLAGPDFRARVASIFETFSAMREDLKSEKKAMMRIWSKREKQIERVLGSTVHLHGELQAIIGQSLPRIDAMELDSIAEEDGDQPAMLFS